MALDTGSQRYVKQYVFDMRVILKSMDTCRNYSITFKIFLKSNLSRKQKVLHFFDNTFIFHGHFVCSKQIKRCFLIRNNAAANIITELTIEASVSELLDYFYLFIDIF